MLSWLFHFIMRKITQKGSCEVCGSWSRSNRHFYSIEDDETESETHFYRCVPCYEYWISEMDYKIGGLEYWLTAKR